MPARILLLLALVPLHISAATFTDLNFNSGNYNAPTIYNNGATASGATFSGGQVHWTATFGAAGNAGFSLVNPGFTYDPAGSGSVVSIDANTSMSVTSTIPNTAPSWRLFILQGGELYRALITGPVSPGFSTVSSGPLTATNFDRIGPNGIVTSGNPNLTNPFVFGFGTQYAVSVADQLAVDFASLTINVNTPAAGVPEPSGIALVVTGLALAAARRYRR